MLDYIDVLGRSHRDLKRSNLMGTMECSGEVTQRPRGLNENHLTNVDPYLIIDV